MHFLVGDDCLVNGQPCPGLLHSICHEERCHCNPGFYGNQGLCKAELGEAPDNSDLCDYNSALIEYRNGRCLCIKNQFYNSNLRTCVKRKLRK